MKTSDLQIGTGLFVYNRPLHTQKVLQTLQKNPIPKLYVFCDGPKDGVLTEDIKKTREVVSQVDWCPTEIVVHEKNLGITRNIVFGLNRMFERNEAAIVLEDDCIVREDFYLFMSACLNFYRDDQRIFNVNGYQFPIRTQKPKTYNAYFSPLAMCWGWGFWRRSFRYFRLNVDDALEYFKSPESRRLTYIENGFPLYLKDIIEGRLDSFTYRWNYLMNKHEGYCIAPYETFVHNIGFDATGVHCRRNSKLNVLQDVWERPVAQDQDAENWRLPREVVRDPFMDQKARGFYWRPYFLKKYYRLWKNFWKKK